MYKSGDATNPANYRPISTLSSFSKVFEKLIYNQLYNFFKKCSILYKYQFGFRKGYSTDQAILEITDSLKKAMDKKLVTCGFFLDFSKAFDTINHDILLSKLYRYAKCILGNPLRWFENYLFNGNQVVRIWQSYHYLCYTSRVNFGSIVISTLVMICQTVQANYPSESLLW